MDVLADEHGKQAFVYSKMCRFVVIGFIHEPKPERWRGTKIHVRRGRLGATRYAIPEWLVDHLNVRANMAARAFTDLSTAQTDAIKKIFRTRPDQIAQSEVARAMAHDIRLSGFRAAYMATRPKKDDEEKS